MSTPYHQTPVSDIIATTIFLVVVFVAIVAGAIVLPPLFGRREKDNLDPTIYSMEKVQE